MKKQKQDGFAQDFLQEAKHKGSVKSLGDVVGLPDKEDWVNICNMISVFRKESVKHYGFDILVDCIATGKRDYELNGGKYDGLAPGYNLVNKDSAMRYHFELPESFVHVIERAYPLMFTNKDHYHWFCKHFSELSIAERI
jgi:hypothetical protein